MTTDPIAEHSGRPVTLVQAVRIAHEYITSIADFMKGKVYALEETEYDATGKRFFITISLQRVDAPKRFQVRPSVSMLSDMLKPPPEVNCNYIFRIVEVDEQTGNVTGMREPAP